MAAPDLLQGRPATGIGHYLRDVVYGANDGVVTTLAVISGVTGASLAPSVALVLGLANLVGDGFSMGVGNYLSLKSELAQRGIAPAQERPARHGFATFVAFALAGGVPLLVYAVPGLAASSRFLGALVLAAVTLAAVGAWRAPFVKASRTRSVAEMVGIGGLAAAGAYAVGALAHRFVIA